MRYSVGRSVWFRRAAAVLLVVLAFLIIYMIIVLIQTWLDKDSKDNPPAKPQTTTLPATNTGKTGTSSTSTTVPNGQILSNSGPGDVFALFAGVSAVSTLGFHLIQRKKYS